MCGRTLGVALLFATLCLCQDPDRQAELKPIRFKSLTFRPSGFFEWIGEIRSKATPDTINTRFASLPFAADHTQMIASPAHSRVALHGETPLWKGTLTGYIEADFLQPGGQQPWRWRQFWGEYRIGKWRLLGGKGWSLLRPNRAGLTSEAELMNTLVIEPAYHVGLLGLRRQELRLIYDATPRSHVAIEYESGGRYLAKYAQDRNGLHWEAIAFAGTRGRRGGAIAHLLRIRARPLRIVGEVGLGRGLGPEALGILAAGSDVFSFIEGVEVPTGHWTFFAYGGFARAYGLITASTDNRLEQQWTAGAQRITYQGRFGTMRVGAQVSQLARSLWSGREADMTYYMAALRWESPRFADRSR